MKIVCRIVTFLGFGVFLFGGALSSQAAVVINEFLADVPLGLAGDANRDGVRSASDDEFVELFNSGGLSQDLSLWSLWDASALRYLFSAGSMLGPSERFVIFGGGNPQGISGSVEIASTGGLSLNNTSDTIRLKDALGNVVDQILYGSEANQDQSLTRFPEGTGSFERHSVVSSAGLLFSPGTDPEGRDAEIPPIPEPPLGFLFSGGIFALVWTRTRFFMCQRQPSKTNCP